MLVGHIGDSFEHQRFERTQSFCHRVINHLLLLLLNAFLLLLRIVLREPLLNSLEVRLLVFLLHIVGARGVVHLLGILAHAGLLTREGGCVSVLCMLVGTNHRAAALLEDSNL